MNPSKVIAVFAAAVLVAVAGWFGGGLLRDALTPEYETAIGVVKAQAGMPVETATPTPSASAPPTTPAPTPTEAPTPTPEPTRDGVQCEGAKPGENCECELRNGEWVWVCEIPTTAQPTQTPFPTP